VKTVKCAVIGLAAGFGGGLVMFFLAFAFERDPALISAWRFVHKPALLLADWWLSTDLPPRGEVAWAIAPLVGVLSQWIILGVVAGLCFGFRRTRKHSDN